MAAHEALAETVATADRDKVRAHIKIERPSVNQQRHRSK
jgi:hypothetical protein